MNLSKEQIAKLEAAFNSAIYTNGKEVHDKFIERIIGHDYSYQWSDDHRAWSSGQRSLELLRAQVHGLITVFGYNPETLLKECLEARSEQYTDGLTHKVIKGLFEPYNVQGNDKE